MKLLPCAFVTHGLQGAWVRLCPEYSLYRCSIKGLIPEGVLKCHVNVVALIVLLHAEDVPGVEPAVSRMPVGKATEKLFRYFS